MHPTGTPTSITSTVLDFCRHVNPAGLPLYVTITPAKGCRANDCFGCVKEKLERDGGRIQFGWAIWEWPGVYIEAEHHAVYDSQTGPPLLDITPSQLSQVRRRLFLPDDNAFYDFENEGVRRDNIRSALTDDVLIQQFFAAASEKSRVWNTVPGVGVVSLDRETCERLERLERDLGRVFYDLAIKYTPRGALCFCDSGKKFKRCHGQSRISK
jgi:hypothetical protein